MDQFDDFEVEEPKQEPFPQNQQTGDTQITNPIYNVVNSANSNVMSNNTMNAANTGAPATYIPADARRVPCPKCGELMVEGSRYCMHCGELDFNNSQNQSVKKAFFLGKKMRASEERRKQRMAKKSWKMNSLDSNGISKQEKTYTFFKKIFSFLILVAIVVAAINYKSILKVYDNFCRSHYLKQVDAIIEGIEKEYSPSNCKYTSENGKIYFSFTDAKDYFSISSSFFTFDHFSGSIEIIQNGETYEYIVTIYDGKYGINKVNYKDLKPESIQKMDAPEMPTGSFTCE